MRVGDDPNAAAEACSTQLGADGRPEQPLSLTAASHNAVHDVAMMTAGASKADAVYRPPRPLPVTNNRSARHLVLLVTG